MGPSRPAGPGEQRPTPPTEQDGPLEEMAKYTMALKEHGDCIDAQPSYKTITISQYPSRFMSVVSFGGSEENGESRTKRDAKHIASKKMCERLAIRLA
jgi:dsRNA-specific ribonuclease